MRTGVLSYIDMATERTFRGNRLKAYVYIFTNKHLYREWLIFIPKKVPPHKAMALGRVIIEAVSSKCNLC